MYVCKVEEEVKKTSWLVARLEFLYEFELDFLAQKNISSWLGSARLQASPTSETVLGLTGKQTQPADLLEASSHAHFAPTDHPVTGPTGTPRSLRSLKLLSNRFGGVLSCCKSTNKYEKLDSELEKKMMEAKQRNTQSTKIKSINSIILRFPQFREGLEEIRGIFHQFDVDSNGILDRGELIKCLQKLQFDCTEEEINDLFDSCDLGRNKGIKFNEFVVVLCLIYLVAGTLSSNHMATSMGSPEPKATFDSMIDAFLFLDKNGDGKLDKKDMIKAMNDDSSKEKSPTHVTMTRFKELDWNKDGKVGFREFIFSLIIWVGFDSKDEISVMRV
ncbi:hypothetical protein R6Q57_010253 [Mikania cordata]